MNKQRLVTHSVEILYSPYKNPNTNQKETMLVPICGTAIGIQKLSSERVNCKKCLKLGESK